MHLLCTVHNASAIIVYFSGLKFKSKLTMNFKKKKNKIEECAHDLFDNMLDYLYTCISHRRKKKTNLFHCSKINYENDVYVMLRCLKYNSCSFHLHLVNGSCFGRDYFSFKFENILASTESRA